MTGRRLDEDDLDLIRTLTEAWRAVSDWLLRAGYEDASVRARAAASEGRKVLQLLEGRGEW
ncbi:MAG: hypothetical protein QN193_01780 [Armatimonadota bacterium]|nr:hypothetical protein [Armatimonadota bacterium]MDR7443479.1 hypothetical protein [Armatimonadota bacterium]MDR7569318.1 hypothetical protein [Armatimonadota bacterium]MDR7614978.1 hypothetical protein [Armatimonadota bacterium]